MGIVGLFRRRAGTGDGAVVDDRSAYWSVCRVRNGSLSRSALFFRSWRSLIMFNFNNTIFVKIRWKNYAVTT